MPEDKLPLPIDIPWQRRCVTDDMVDTAGCGHDRAPRWQPSIAVFEYEPPPPEQPLKDSTVSYLKVVVTLTGNSLEEKNTLGYLGSYYYDEDVNLFLVESAADHLPCHGALVHVSVFPRDSDMESEEYPYIIDVEPKKRELYERVTQTGSALSRSLAATSVSKGGVGLSGTEVIDGGTVVDWSALGKLGGAAAGGAVGGAAGAGIGGAVGGPLASALGEEIEGLFSDKPTNKSPVSAVEMSDRSQEKRETYSHTTELAQLHSLLTSYHTGTNRALFFLQPPPHMVQTNATLINGPRALEGVQEFLLAVVRHKKIADYCVRVTLESAYVSTAAGRATKTDSLTFEEKDNWPTDNMICGPGISKSQAIAAGQHVKVGPFIYAPPPGWELDTSTNNQATEYSTSHPDVEVCISVDEIEQRVSITLDVPPVDAHQSGCWFMEYPDLTVWIKFLLRRKLADENAAQISPSRIYVEQREVCCCWSQEAASTLPPFTPGIVFEQPIPEEETTRSRDCDLVRANQVADKVGRSLLNSIGSPGRYERLVSDLETDFIASRIADLIGFDDHPDDTPVAAIEGLDDSFVSLAQELKPGMRRSDLLRMSLRELCEDFDLAFETALDVRRAALRLKEMSSARTGRRGHTARPREHTVPRLVGMRIIEAKQALRNLGMTWQIHRVDSAQPVGRVLEQHPESGQGALAGDECSLWIASGATVEIPKVEGLELSRALAALRAAGLESEPLLSFKRVGRSTSTFAITSIRPPSGHLVTPHAQVVLVASSNKAESLK